MKTRLINFRTTEERYSQIKRLSDASRLSITDILEQGLALFMDAISTREQAADPWDRAFEKLLGSGKISPLTAEERAVVENYEARKAAGTVRTMGSQAVLADLRAELDGAKKPEKDKHSGPRGKPARTKPQ